MAITSGADLSVIEGRLTAARAGYIDNLSAGAAALQATAAAIPTSPIKNIQRVDVTFSSGTSVDNTTITAVVIAKSVIVDVTIRANQAVPLNDDDRPYFYFQSTTNIRGNTWANVPVDLNISLFVVEYN